MSIYEYPEIERVIYGLNSMDHIEDECSRLGCNRVMLLTTQSLANSTILEKVRHLLGNRCVVVSSETKQHVLLDSFEPLIREVRNNQIDGIVSLGGGSVIDSAKVLVALLAQNYSDALDLLKHRVTFEYPDRISFTALSGSFIPHVAIPTTLSAAEYDGIFSMTYQGVKYLGMDSRLSPKVIILDPFATSATPKPLWAATGMRAVDHAVETYLSKVATAPTDATSLHALSLLSQYLVPSWEHPEDNNARLQCQLAGWLSMFGVNNVTLGLSHGIGHQLGAYTNIPHGVTSCITLPKVMARMVAIAPHRMRDIAVAMGVNINGMTLEQSANSACSAVKNLIQKLQLPSRLRDVGVEMTAIEPIAKEAIRDMVVAFSPLKVDQKGIEEILRECY